MSGNPTIRRFEAPAQLFAELRVRFESSVSPGDLVAVPTGNTPLPLYRAARATPSSRDLWAGLRYLQLDEYIDPPAGTESFRRYLERELLDPLGVPAERRLLIPEGLVAAGDLDEIAAALDGDLERNGPLAAVVLGLGGNGHIAFNEPASARVDGYHRVTLAAETVQTNFPGSPDLSVDALTIGIDQILAAERVLLVVPQPHKQEILDRALAGPVDPGLPASALQGHGQLEVFRCGP